MICDTPTAVSLSLGAPPRKSAIAIGIGWALPWVMSRRTCAGAIRADSSKAPALALSWSARRRVKDNVGVEIESEGSIMTRKSLY